MLFSCKTKKYIELCLLFAPLIIIASSSTAQARLHENKYEEVVSAKKFAMAMVINLMTLNSRAEYDDKIIQYKDFMTEESCLNHIMFLKNYNLYDQVAENELPMSTALWDVRLGLDGFEQITIIEEDKNDHGLQTFNFKVPIQVTFDQGWKDITYNVITSVHVTQKKAEQFSWVLSDWDLSTKTKRKFTRGPMDYNAKRSNKEDIMCKQNLDEKNALAYFRYP